MADNISEISQLLVAALDPKKRAEAERRLAEEEGKPDFTILLLRICATTQTTPDNTKLASALYFKNLIRRKWRTETGEYLLPQSEVAQIKELIVDLMIQTPARIRAQLGEAIGLIADSDFPDDWSDLPKNLAGRLDATNVSATIGVLQVAHAITHRWRPLVGSNALNAEINLVLNDFSKPFLECIGQTYSQIIANRDNPAILQDLYLETDLAMQIMYDLACQDLPPVYEDNQDGLTEMLHLYLTLEVSLPNDDNSEATIIETVRGDICDLACLFATKYYEDFTFQKLATLVDDTSKFLANVGPEPKYDLLVSKALHLLTAVCGTNEFVQRYNSESALASAIERTILPNITLREVDVELFEDEPIEFVRRDLEGSDNDTRRRAAIDLLGQFSRFFSQLTTSVAIKYVDHYLADYRKNPEENWKSKDTAVYLYSSVAATGAVTADIGVRTVNPLVNVVEFFDKNIVDDLSSDAKVESLIRIDAVKYLYMFRSQLTKQQWRRALPTLMQNVSSSNYAVCTYSTIAIERILALSTNSPDPVFSPEDVNQIAKDLLSYLLQLILQDLAPQKIQENEFLMRCVMRIIFVIKEQVRPLAKDLLAKLVEITKIICQNPSNPKFYYYHFEALGGMVRYAASTDSSHFEQALVGPFGTIIESDVQEFTPYLFQLLAALLEASPGSSLPPTYQNFFMPLLAPALWVRGNVPALTRLMSSFIARDGALAAQEAQLLGLLGIFQHLLASKATEAYAFDLLESIISHVPSASLQPYWTPIFNLILQRLQNTKTEMLSGRFTRFYCLIAAKGSTGLGPDFFVSVLESIQAELFTQLYLQIIMKQVPLLKRNIDRKTAIVGLSRTAGDSDAFAVRYKKGWVYTVDAVLSLLENPPVVGGAAPGSQHANGITTNGDASVVSGAALQDLDAEGQGFGAGFTQLASCTRTVEDPFPDTGPDLRRWVGSYFKDADQRHGGRLSGFVGERLSDQSKQVLLSYMA